MLAAFTFRAKPGHEKDLETLLNDQEMARRISRAMGVTRNILFFSGGRMVRVVEFPDGTHPRPLASIAREDPAVDGFLRQLGTLVEDGFDLDEPATLEAFNARITLPRVFDIMTDVVQPSRVEM